MRHAREDYNRIQDPAGLIDADEPVFLIRAKDVVSGDAVRAWANLHLMNGGDPEMARAACQHAALMDAWPTKQKADAPDGALPR
jgi:hypothetical protein